MSFQSRPHGRAASAAPPLPASSGKTITVNSESELQSAVRALTSDTTITIAPGVYRLTRTLWINAPLRNVSIRGASGNPDDVVLAGPGMSEPNVGDVPYGIYVDGGADEVEIASLTLRGFYYRAMVLMPGTRRPHIYGVRFVDSGEQFIDARADDRGSNGVGDGVIEYSQFEYTASARQAGVPAVALRGATNWIIRNSDFRNLVGPSSQWAGPAILAWGGSSGTVVDSNTFVNTSSAIAFGRQDSDAVEHVGGMIRNNMIFRAAGISGDTGIRVVNAPDAQVLNNTVFLSRTYGTPIEYQGDLTRDAVVANNLIDGTLWARDGATAAEAGNVVGATAEMFVDAARGDLRLSRLAILAIDRGVTLDDVPFDWSGAPRPSGRGYDVGADEYGAVVAKPEAAQSAGISGTVVDSKGTPLANVTIKLTGSETHQSTTGSAGAYSFPSLTSGGSYTVTPSLSGYTFTPASANFSDETHKVTANFTGMAAAPAPAPSPTVTVAVTANPTSITAGQSSTITLTTSGSTRVYLNVALNGVAMTLAGCTTSCSYTATVTPAQTTTYTPTATDSNGTPITNIPSATVTVTASAPAPVATLTANPTNITAGQSSTLTLATNSTDYHNVAINGTILTNWICTSPTSCSGTLIVAPTQTTTYTSSATTAAGTPYTMPSVTVTVATTAPSGTATLTASPTSITAGQSSTLTLSTPTTDYHNVFINNVRPTLVGCTTGCTYTMAVTPSASTTYQSAATNGSGTAYAMPSVSVSVTAATAPAPAPAPTAPTPSGSLPTKLLQAGNLTDTGTFAMPEVMGTLADGTSIDETQYANGAIAFNPANQSLFLVGHDWGQHIGELSIPGVGGTASVIQGFTDALEGRLALIDSDGEAKKVGGLYVNGATSALHVSGYVYYDGTGDATSSHFTRSTNLSSTAVVGPLRVGTLNPGFYGGYFTAIPSEWQAALGGDLLVGQCCTPVISRTSYGPDAFAVTSSDLERGASPAAAQALLYYDQSHQSLGQYGVVGATNPAFNGTTHVKGAAIIPGTASLLYFGMTGTGPYCYGEGTSNQSLAGTATPDGSVYCYDPANAAKGEHAYPYSGYVWAYNLNDLTAVKAGTKAPWDVLPYATWTTSVNAFGVAYDPATGRLFVSEPSNTVNIHIFKVQ